MARIGFSTSHNSFFLIFWGSPISLSLNTARLGSLLGVGTIANMVLCGYSVDFFGWVIDRLLPVSFFQSWPVRIGICIPALLLFILAAAVYLSLDVGVSPYDAIPMIIAQRQSRLSFRAVRTLWDMPFTSR